MDKEKVSQTWNIFFYILFDGFSKLTGGNRFGRIYVEKCSLALGFICKKHMNPCMKDPGLPCNIPGFVDSWTAPIISRPGIVMLSINIFNYIKVLLNAHMYYEWMKYIWRTLLLCFLYHKNPSRICSNLPGQAIEPETPVMVLRRKSCWDGTRIENRDNWNIKQLFTY